MEDKTRVQKFIAVSGLCSRRAAEELIKQGKVKVNGETISIGDSCLKTDKIEVDGKVISFNLNDKVYIVLNKSSGYVTTNEDEFGRKTVFDFLDEKDKRDNLFSVGRLDKDTSGLLMAAKNPASYEYFKQLFKERKVKKTYLALVSGVVSKNEGVISLPIAR